MSTVVSNERPNTSVKKAEGGSEKMMMMWIEGKRRSEMEMTETHSSWQGNIDHVTPLRVQ